MPLPNSGFPAHINAYALFVFAAHALFLDHNMLKGDFIALNSYTIWLTPVFLGLQESIEDIIKVRANKRRVNECLRTVLYL